MVGQLVLKLNHTRKKTKGGKLKKRYTGPYKIISVKPQGAYEISSDCNFVAYGGQRNHSKLHELTYTFRQEDVTVACLL